MLTRRKNGRIRSFSRVSSFQISVVTHFSFQRFTTKSIRASIVGKLWESLERLEFFGWDRIPPSSRELYDCASRSSLNPWLRTRYSATECFPAHIPKKKERGVFQLFPSQNQQLRRGLELEEDPTSTDPNQHGRNIRTRFSKVPFSTAHSISNSIVQMNELSSRWYIHVHVTVECAGGTWTEVGMRENDIQSCDVIHEPTTRSTRSASCSLSLSLSITTACFIFSCSGNINYIYSVSSILVIFFSLFTAYLKSSCIKLAFYIVSDLV